MSNIFLKSDGKYIAIKFDNDIIGDPTESVNVDAFSISGNVYNGVLTETTFAIDSISRDADSMDTLILEVGDLTRFESVIGELTIHYDSEIGNLSGVAGPAPSFNYSFMPTDLIWKKHPNCKEHLEISNIVATGTLININDI